ncbi:MAG: GldG family protein [Verrucomicrobia bacterium]|nr:GldG family protein [Verrucomicrobiota bacterium]
MALDPQATPPTPSARPDPASEAAQDRRAGREAVRRQRRRRTASGANVTISIALAFILLVMLNHGAYRHFPERWDISSLRYYALSPKTLNMLEGVRGEIKCITLFQADMSLGDEMRRLLEEYVYEAQRIGGLKITLESVDPDRDLVRTRELTVQYDVSEANGVIVAMDGRYRIVTEKHLVDYERVVDSSQMASGHMRVDKKRRGFLGEQVISSSIQSLAEERRPLVYVLTGHGERNIEEFSSASGYATVARTLRRDNIELRPLLLAETRTVPEDCSALVIAGPERRLAEGEAALIGEYLERSGRLLLLTDPGTQSGLEPMLETWGVHLSRDRVVGLTLTGRELFVRDYGAHPITAPLDGMVTMFLDPRSVEPVVDEADAKGLPADRPRVTKLAYTQDGWAEFNFTQSPPRFEADTDRAAPVAVAVAVERGAADGIQMELRPTRMVVIGDSDFVANGALQNGVGANIDLFMNAVNWLVTREQLLAIGAKSPIDLRLEMNDQQSRIAFFLLVLALPSAVAIFGVAVWWNRRR